MTHSTTSSRCRTSARAAFTLVELIVATIMLSILVTATYAAIGQVTRARDRSTSRAQAHQRANLAADLIAADVQQSLRDADLFLARIAILNARPAGRGRDQLLLSTHIGRPIRPLSGQNEGSECESQFRLDPSPSSPDLFTLWRRRQPVPDEQPDAGGVAAPLVDGLTAMYFEAFDGSAWTTVWDTDNDGYPHALRLTVVAADDAGRSSASARRVVAFDRTPPPIKFEDESSTTSTSGNASTTGQ